MGTRGLRNFFRLNALGCCTVIFCAVAVSVRATTITVTNTNDNGVGSLRQALVIANDNDTITFAVTGGIVLTSGELLVDKSITVAGPGLENLAVDGNANSRVLPRRLRNNRYDFWINHQKRYGRWKLSCWQRRRHLQFSSDSNAQRLRDQRKLG